MRIRDREITEIEYFVEWEYYEYTDRREWVKEYVWRGNDQSFATVVEASLSAAHDQAERTKLNKDATGKWRIILRETKSIIKETILK